MAPAPDVFAGANELTRNPGQQGLKRLVDPVDLVDEQDTTLLLLNRREERSCKKERPARDVSPDLVPVMHAIGFGLEQDDEFLKALVVLAMAFSSLMPC